MTILIRTYRQGYALWDGDARVSEELDWKQAAARRATLKKLALRSIMFKDRRCLTCPTVFPSEGPHHRLCQHCRQTIGGLDRQMVG